MPCPSSPPISLLDIKTEMGSAANPFSLLTANAGGYGGLSSTACGSWTANGSTPVDLLDFLNYDHSFAGCEAADTLEDAASCTSMSSFGCGADGDTYSVYHDGCCSYYCSFVSFGCA